MLTVLFSVCLYLTGLFIVTRETKKVENFYHDSESEFSKNDKLLAIKSITTSNKEILDELRRFFIQKGDEVKFIEQMEKVAKDSSVNFDIATIDIKQNPDDSFKEDINVKISISGSWGNLMSFLGKLERMPFGVSIKNTTLNMKNSGEWMGFVEILVFREK
jgi:Tfp pilus assembly protein PilO